MKIEPMGDMVLIEPIKNKKETDSGFLMTEVENEKPEQGKVFAVGENVKKLKKGDVVVFSPYGPNEITIDNKDYLIAKEEDILARIKK